MADGSIRIETKLDNTALRQQVKELERELKGIQKEQAKTEAQAGKVREKYNAEREYDKQFPEEFSQRQDIDNRSAKELDPIVAKQEELNQKEQEYLQKLEAVNAKLAEQANIAAASKQVDNEVKADNTVAKIKNQAQYNSLLEETEAKMAAIEAAAARIAAQTGLTKEQILGANPEYQKLSDIMGILKSRAGEFGDEADNAGKKASRSMKDAGKSAEGLGKVLKKGIKTIGKMTLAIFGIRGAYMAVRMAMNEYMATNEKLAGQIASIKAVFGQVLGPVIEWVVNLFVQAISVVNAFVNALSGINFIARANAAALKKQEKATGGAAKAANQLASFDEQTKLNDTSGGGGGGSAPSLLDETMDNIPKFMEKLIEQIKAGDWFGAGETVGESIMEAIESVDWRSLGSKIGEIIGGAISFAAGLLVGIDPATLFKAAREALIGLFDSLSSSISSVDWGQVGAKIVEFILLRLATMNPATLIITMMLTPGGDELTQSASRLVGSIVGALASAIVGAAKKIGELASEIWTTIKTYFDGYVDWEGTPEDIINGLWEGIKNALSNAGQWIYNNIWVPFRDGFKEAFGIHSPSKKMEEFGDFLIQGLFNGIRAGIARIGKVCSEVWNAIKGVFASADVWLENKFGDAWIKVKNKFSQWKSFFSGLWETIKNTFTNIGTNIAEAISGAVKSGINGVISKIESTMNRGVRLINGAIGLINKIPGVSVGTISTLSLPRLARGGIVNRPGRGVPAIIGEAGAEAVLPLENNTEWMDILADKIGGGTITIPITLDGKKIATYVVDIQKKKAFAMNGA